MSPAARFRMLMRVEVRHAFFADGYARRLVFRAHAGTTTFLQRFGAIVRRDDYALAIGVDDARLPGLWSERMDGDGPRLLRFDLYCGDPAHGYYTEPVTTSGEGEDDGVLVAPLDLDAATPGRLNPPLATLALPLVPEGANSLETWSSALDTRYRLRLRSPRTVWKYVLAGDWQGRELSIVDARGEIGFTDMKREVLPDGQAVMVARSVAPIDLHERPPQRFQLRDVTAIPERTLISRLPGAAPQRLWRETVEGEPTVVSEIFVHS
ncbi:hypothetical protein [Luteibacter yeojuensis]|uniref:Uncharacterized protein n=1 Tax=Luteibacter yeojuensis TaxID=345309 RepID=A0A7X5TPG7_9GAMM|nr:hypothetical protein [Luteibacter yeojuensis]NID14704.1 hypothetical protein [Luteibacter yeojuensis]